MNILQLCSGNEVETQLGNALGNNKHRVIVKQELVNASFISYDAFIITTRFIDENGTSFLNDIISLNKPVIYIYDSFGYEKNNGMLFLEKTYNVKFLLSDCSILDTGDWSYKPCESFNENYFAMTSSIGNKYCFVKNTDRFLVFKYRNVVIMHDLVLPNISGHFLLNGLYELLDLVLEMEDARVSVPDWIELISILDDDYLKEEKSKIINDIKIKTKKLSDIDKSIQINNDYKKILYSSGNELVDMVSKILIEMLNVSIDDVDIKKQDLYFKLDEINILVEVKGVNHSFQRGNIGQAKRHVIDYAYANDIYGEDIKKYCKGVLIINPYSLHELKDKISKDFYSPEVISDAQYENICTLDTLTLLNLFSKWKKSPEQVDLKKIILTSTYVEPYFDEIIRIDN